MDTANKITFVVIGFALKTIWDIGTKLFKWSGKKLYSITISPLQRKIKKSYGAYSEQRKYKKKIKLMERKKIPIPSYFLAGKTKSSHPELKRIFEMIESGELEPPIAYKLSKMYEEKPDLQVFKDGFDLDMSKSPPRITFKDNSIDK